MIQQEEILLKTDRTGVTFYTFSTKAFNQTPENEEQYGGPFPSYVLYNNNNQPTGLYNFDGVNLLGMNSKYNYVAISQLTTNYFVTGYSVVNIIDSNLSDEEIQDKINLSLSRLADPTKTPNANGAKNHVFYKKHVLSDMFVNIKMERSFNSLDTLKVYNNLINSIPTQEAKTGVVFGSLTASQQITDENGLTVKIPLRNVPVGIFKKSETFPATTSLDDDGNRISLNLTQSSPLAAYFNTESFDNDLLYLQNGSAFTSVPDQYKYVTFTNENGEFIIYDVPIGEQVLMFEVDLFKQGLTKDEIQHNFFPFPVNENPNIDNIPSFFFRQVPIDVFPAWGTSQTGYTEVDVNVNLDLRKWTTYIFAPAAYGNEKLEVSTARNAANTFKIEILDMTSEGFIQKPVEVVQVANDLDRQEGDQYLWYDEFKSKRKRLEYSQFGCHVLKLPGNIYDPNAYRTNKDGIPANGNSFHKGVWLSAYEFACYVNPIRNVRYSGGFRNRHTHKVWSHFNLNYTQQNTISNQLTKSLNQFPYEKKWSINYPTPYSIAKKPVLERYAYRSERTFGAVNGDLSVPTPHMAVQEPAYSDGDLVGNVYVGAAGGDAGGFGLQVKDNVYFPNRIASVATLDYMYKYEKGVAWNERYANGYEPYWTSATQTFHPIYFNGNPWNYHGALALNGMSSVNGGEAYQRLECGYGYFMKYQDWNLVWRWPWATDIYFQLNSNPGYTSDGIYAFGAISINGSIVNTTNNTAYYAATTWNLDDLNYAFGFDQLYNNGINEGGIDIYRIVNSGTENIKLPEQFLIPTYAMMRFGGKANRLWTMIIVNSGVKQVSIKNRFNSEVWVEGNSVAPTNLWIEKNEDIVLDLGGYLVIDSTVRTNTQNPTRSRYNVPNSLNPKATVEYTELTFEGNTSFNPNTNRYDSVVYDIQIRVDGGINYGGTQEQNTPYWYGDKSALTYWSKNAATNPQNSKSKIVCYATSGNNGGAADGVEDDQVAQDGNKSKLMYRVSIENTV